VLGPLEELVDALTSDAFCRCAMLTLRILVASVATLPHVVLLLSAALDAGADRARSFPPPLSSRR
jgi:hypothetical protein